VLCVHARYLPRFEVGFFIFVIGFSASNSHSIDVSGYLKGHDTPVAYAQLTFVSEGSEQLTRIAISDSIGWFLVKNITTGTWIVTIQALGYASSEKKLIITPQTSSLTLQIEPLPIIIDELIVQEPRYERSFDWSENIYLDSTMNNNLAATLDAVAGVNVRRYGGLGSFSTVSIRGSTSEQVQIYIDGVPLSSAVGGGVDLSRISLAGIERIDIYRGAVPAQLGGHSVGGVVHLRTKRLPKTISTSFNASEGSFNTRQLTASLALPWQRGRYLYLAEYQKSGNMFRYWDDNGTPYNNSDDGWAKRINSDFKSFHALAKAHWPYATRDINIYTTLNLNHKGIPGIGPNPSQHARFNTWRNITEATLTGRWGKKKNIYRLKAHSIVEESTFKDSLGEVGIDMQNMHNRMQSYAIIGESTIALPLNTVMNVFTSQKKTLFTPNDRLRKSRTLPKSTRFASTVGSEIKIPLLNSNKFGLRISGQKEHRRDLLFEHLAGIDSKKRHLTKTLSGIQAGISADVKEGWKLRVHVGKYRRAPSFFELFGDRGAVAGNVNLTNEHSKKHDIALLYQTSNLKFPRLTLLEISGYYNRAKNLIRFIHNSQYISRPYNIGAAQLSGIETRCNIYITQWLRFKWNYVYQHTENLSPFPYENRRDLPNAPRHRLNANTELSVNQWKLNYDVNIENRHFIDRANLRNVAGRVLHDLRLTIPTKASATFIIEICNLSNNQTADLWAYPLPGRSFFLTLNFDKKISANKLGRNRS